VRSTRKPLWIVNAGRIAYGPAFDLQRAIVAARKAGAVPDVLLFCEHPHVITLGRNGQRENLLAGANVLKQMNVEFHETDRGGDITYHGPGQIVGYPILDLTQHKRDVRWYVEQLEEVMIRTAADYGLAARRILCRHGIWIEAPSEAAKLPAGTRPDFSFGGPAKSEPGESAVVSSGYAAMTLDREAQLPPKTSAAGAAQLSPARKGWVDHEKVPSPVGATQITAAKCASTPEIAGEEKLAALGVHLSRWVTSHGFAFNVSTDLRYFDLIIPCGIKDKRATSLERALGRPVSLDEARARLAAHFAEIFNAEPCAVSFDELQQAISAIKPT
jgi:lipoate-protein ligase B